MGVERKAHIDGLDTELTQTIEERVSEFERKHEPDVLRDGPGWVPRIQKIDYVIAIGINAAIVLWLVVSLLWN